MDRISLIALLGLLMLGIGSAMALTGPKEELDEHSWQNILLTKSNSSWTISLGRLEKGFRVSFVFGIKDTNIDDPNEVKRALVMLIRTSTKEPLRLRAAVGAGEYIWNWTQAGYNDRPGWDILVDDFYEMSVSKFEPASEIKFLYFKIWVSKPVEGSHQIGGAALTLVGAVTLFISVMLRKRRTKGTVHATR